MKNAATVAPDTRVARFTSASVRTSPEALAEALQGPFLSIGEKLERLRVRSLIITASAEATQLALCARNEATWAEGSRAGCLVRAAKHEAVAAALCELLESVGPMPRAS